MGFRCPGPSLLWVPIFLSHKEPMLPQVLATLNVLVLGFACRPRASPS